jgi:serine/threonine protein kinase/Flp pilus assembly protein TadD
MSSPRSDSGVTTPGHTSAGGDLSIDRDGGWLSRQVEAMASAWSRGEDVSAAELLAGHPGLDDEAAIRLIYEEVSLRRESGHDVATTDVVNRYPRWKDELEFLLGCDRMLRPFCRVAVFPSAGEVLGPFQLLDELGRGGSGRTYLASEPALGGRLVVLKVIPDDQEEHLSLARLQHTHIIPLFSEQSYPERRLRALCMPYLGGASLARLLDGVAQIPAGERRGRHLVEVLDRVQAGQSAPGTRDGPWRRRLERASYVEAVCSIAVCLADALECAHTHGLLHMDVKPSNVLIAGDGLPLLLDFHLAHWPIGQGERMVDRMGGTPGWMSPEHRAALEAVAQGEAVPRPVDGRADQYALGLLIREALVGPTAKQITGGRKPWRHENAGVSNGLAEIVDRCLAPAPDARYPDLQSLADDLRRHLGDLPLRGVANRSLAERWSKWRRRRPAALSRWTAGLATVAALAIALYLAQANRGARSLENELARARYGQKAAALHDLAERVRFRYAIDRPAEGEIPALTDKILVIWKERGLLLAPTAGAGDRKTEESVRSDLLDLATTWLELRAGSAAPGSAFESRRDALRFLDEAAASCGESLRLDRLRRALVGSGGEPDALRALTPLEHHELGRAELRAGRFQEAALEFQHVVDDRPLDFWSNFYLGLCDYRLGRFPDALAEFGICVALAPRSAECYYNRARVAEAMGRADQAVLDYGRALEIDPGMTPALLNRGINAYKNGRYTAAAQDLRLALESARDSTTKGQVHYNLALVYLAEGDRAAALASAQEALAHGDRAAAGLLERLGPKP